MAENKTQPTTASVADFLATIEPEGRREDAKRVALMMERLSGHPPVMWGPAIIGFGCYHYRYESGREGDAPRIGFSPRKEALTLYVMDGYDPPALMQRLGKYKTGKSCLYLKRLDDVDQSVLEELIRTSLEMMDQRYPR